MKKLTALAVLALMLGLAATGSASASTNRYQATFVEVGAAIPGGSCGSATISGAGHVAHQCVYLDACGFNCAVRRITFDDGSTLVMHESIVFVVSPGNSAAGQDAPLFLDITQTIVCGTGRFAGATGGGTGRVNTAAEAVIHSSGTITLP
ncbi:MAG: hypothetical protein ACTHKS_18415 [Gaiellaceae bacterium]